MDSTAALPQPAPLTDPLYYLRNFQAALGWIRQRYDDLLSDEARAFIDSFLSLPGNAQALLVRMIMRKGTLFRASRLRYPEIGGTGQAMAPLIALGWVTENPPMTLAELFEQLTQPELRKVFGSRLPAGRKATQQAALEAKAGGPRPFSQWAPNLPEALFALEVKPLCDRLRLMFFGNLRQSWSEFVLAELGVFRYEQVAISRHSRAFSSPADIELALQLHACRLQLEQGLPASDLLPLLPSGEAGTSWLQLRRQRLLFHIGQQAEKESDLTTAASAYRQCQWPGARARYVRVLEVSGRQAAALALLQQALAAPESEAETQQLQRMRPRLQRHFGQPVQRAAAPQAPQQLVLNLPRPATPQSVELLVRDHLHSEAIPVYYVENSLITGLFGLLCWEALFAPLPGAFFHPFHQGPADLLQPDFALRRKALLESALAELDDDRWRTTIRQRFADKHGVHNPFVAWGALDETLLEQALHCLPAAHLRLWFQRLLQDIRAHRAGMPDLIRFDLATRSYEMIEVKGPGDRLQDNQLRWLRFCRAQQMPVRVCYVSWAGADE